MSKKEEKFWVERTNNFNQLRPKGLTLNQVRFFAIYQAKINAREPEKREVVFPLKDFVRIMDLQRLNITKLKNTIDELLRQIVHLPNDRNGFIAIPLFNECEVYQDKDTNEWFVKIECHQKAMPYMFEMKKNYFKYQLWNALRLTSVNQIRMYEILKQYENKGTRTIQLDELKDMLGIDKKQYVRYENFRVRVLESCQKALAENTDIRFEYIPIRTSRKITAIQFNIFKNKEYKDVLQLDEFIDKSDLEDVITEPVTQKKDLKDLYKQYFSSEREEMLRNNIKMLLQEIYETDSMLELRTEAIYKKCVTKFKMQAQSTEIIKPLSYMNGIINNLIDEESKNPKNEQSYNINEFDKYAINYAEFKKVEDKENVRMS